MFRDAFNRENFEFDYQYDWILKKAALKQRLAEANAEAEHERNNKNKTVGLPRNASVDKGVKFT